MSCWVSYIHYRDKNWSLLVSDDGTLSYEQVQKALLMDIRAELKRLNSTLQCSNTLTLAIPGLLRKIRANTARIPVKKVKKATRKRGKR